MKRIKYISRFAHHLSWADVEELGAHAAENNAELGITGILLVAGGVFYQVLEGPDEAVDALYASISSDSRHTDVLLLATKENIGDRLFPDWAMKSFVLDADKSFRLEPLREILQVLFEQRLLIDRLANTLERAIWNELAGAPQE